MIRRMDTPSPPRFGSVSDASGLRLKSKVTELFGHMKELTPGSGVHNKNGGSDPTINKRPCPPAPLQRSTSVSTNRGFQLNPTESPSSSTDTLAKAGVGQGISSSRSYNTELNRSVSSIPSEGSNPSLVRSTSNASNLTSLCVDISPSNSHFFEVLYVGKIKVSHKKVPETLIDDALEKFKRYEVEKARTLQMRRNSLLSSQANSFSNDRDFNSKSVCNQNSKRVDFAPLPLSHRRGSLKDEDYCVRPQDGLVSPSLTPLESVKGFFPETEGQIKEEGEDIEEEFDKLSALRVQNSDPNRSPPAQRQLYLSKRSFPVALEPNVLILNQNDAVQNLDTSNDDESDSSSTLQNKVLEDKLLAEANRRNVLNVKTKHQKDVTDVEEIDEFSCKVSKSRDSIDDKIKEDDRLINGLRNVAMPENKLFNRDRSASIGTINFTAPITQLIEDQNRTMLFQVGRSDLRLISPDRKQILLHKQLRDVASCVQGVSNKEHFGFICKETDIDCFVGYVFKCQSEGVAYDVVGAITQAFVAHADIMRQAKEKPGFVSCEHCPMVWYHKLCLDVEGLSEKRIQTVILRRIENLPDEEQIQVMTKYQGGSEDLYEVSERNAFLMMLLRAHCEAKQQRHVHDTAENRSEFLNQYLGGSTIFMKAKRSLSSSFDHLLKRKASKDDFGPVLKENFKKESSPMSQIMTPTKESNSDSDWSDGKSSSVQKMKVNCDNKDVSLNFNINGNEQTPSPQLKSPMIDIFMKLGNSPSPKNHGNKDTEQQHENPNDSVDNSTTHGSWRQAIFNRVTQTGVLEDGSSDNDNVTAEVLLRRPPSFSNLNQAHPGKRTKAEIKELWKKSITQAILLIRMEKENARLRANQEVSAVKRIKLEYEEIGGCGNENAKVWDVLTAPRESRLTTKVDTHMLFQAIRNGVPRAKRGEVWYFLAEQFCLHQPPPDTKNIPNYSTPYESLLKQLTSHQHAILIDLGRTFPNHTYFSSPMGPGQLALFNLLKAYSLLDPEVGYCQGLSFVAGVLLLHLDEAEAFLMLRHLMFRRGLRRQYLPDMVALQIQLYQLSRLLKDNIPELYDKFDTYDVSPTLYAAPWILTIFTSQFPLGFVTRVFDLLFLESSEVIFRVAIALLEIHKDALMKCESFEEIMDFLKHKMPNIDKPILDKVIKLTFTLDFGKQLNEYQVEYHVLQEEMAAIAPKMEELTRLENQNKKLQEQNRQLHEQLEVSATKISACQVAQCRLESHVKSLEQTVAKLARFIGTTHDKKRDTELPNDIRKLCLQVQQTDRKTLGSLGQKLGQSFSSKFSSTDFSHGNGNSYSEESSSDADDKSFDRTGRNAQLLKTRLSTPNLFGNKETNKMAECAKGDSIAEQSPLEKRRSVAPMKKSLSYNVGLISSSNGAEQNTKLSKESSMNSYFKFPPNVRGYPLRVLDETNEYEEKREETPNDKEAFNNNINMICLNNKIINDHAEPKKPSKFFANSHEQIRQEKLQAEQLKREFDENLKKLDSRLCPIQQQIKSPTSPTSVGFNIDTDKLRLDSRCSNGDSGIGTPVSPSNDKIANQKDFSLVKQLNDLESDTGNHPLVAFDQDIKFDVQSTKLKSLRPTRIVRTPSIDGGDSRN